MCLTKIDEIKEEHFLKDSIFANNQYYYDQLKQLHAEKKELYNLKSVVSLPKPFVIEFTGTPRTGKTTTINNLYDFFKKGGFDVSLIEEFTTSETYKENYKCKFPKKSFKDIEITVIDEVYRQLQNAISSGKEIILVDRSINDRQTWIYRRFIHGDIKENEYHAIRKRYKEISKHLIDFLAITYADPLVSLKRDYFSSLALESRSFLNFENIEEYNNNLKLLQGLFAESVDSMVFLDTTNMNMDDVSIQITSQILRVMKEKYIKALKQKHNLKRLEYKKRCI